MANPFLFFDSIYKAAYEAASANVTASSEAAGYPAANVADMRWGGPYRWRAAGTGSPAWIRADRGASVTDSADTVVIAAHNLASCGATEVAVQCSADDFATPIEIDSADPRDWRDEHPITLLMNDPGEYRYWRIYITGTFTKAPEIGIITLGRRLDFPYGLSPSVDPYAEEPLTDWSENDAGQILGSNFRGVLKRLVIPIDEPGFSDEEFWKRNPGPNFDDDFIPWARRNAFWYSWNLDREPYHVWLSRLDGGHTSPHFNILGRRTGSIPIRCFVPIT